MELEPRYCTLCGPATGKRQRFAARLFGADLTSGVFSARRAPDRRHFRIMECERCGMLISDPAAPATVLAGLYEESRVDYEAHEQDIFASYAPVLDRALAGLKGRRLFLEIGGGSGFMLRYGVEKGFAEQVEIEPSADAEQRFTPAGTSSRFVRGIFEPGALPAASVSLACFFQMLDHVPDPRGFLAAVHEVLEPGGVAVCVTHDTSALSARLLGERSPIYDIEHTYLFNPSNLAELFRAAGFAKVQAFPVANRYSLAHWGHLAPLPRALKGLATAFLERTGLARLRLRLRAGNLGVMATK